MSENLPATRPLMSTELSEVRQLGDWLAKAERNDGTAESLGAAAALRTYYARQLLGQENTLAAGELAFVRGRLVPTAKLLRAIAARHGYRVVSVECDDDHCVAAVIRTDTGEELGRATYTMKMAQRAGLVRDGSGYKKNPDRMMWARAAKRALDEYAPEATLNISTAEEVEEIAASEPEIPWPADPEPEEADYTPLDQVSEYDAEQDLQGSGDPSESLVDSRAGRQGTVEAEDATGDAAGDAAASPPSPDDQEAFPIPEQAKQGRGRRQD